MLQVNIMKIVTVRKSCRGERILAIPKELAERIQVNYMNVELDASGRLTYTPIQGGGMKIVCQEAVTSSLRVGGSPGTTGVTDHVLYCSSNK
jgi:hypothetical protein